MSANALANRSIRSIHTELNFLADSGLITPDALSKILSLLPTPSSGLALPTPPTPIPTPTYSNTPTPTPIPTNEKSLLLDGPAHDPEPPSYAASTPSAAFPPGSFRARALWAYTNNEDGDLTFAQGAEILVLKKDNSEWWSGAVIDPRTGAPAKERGIFPASYVEAIVVDGKKDLVVGQNNGNGHTSGDMGAGYLTGITGSSSGVKKEEGDSNGKKFGKKLGNAAIFGAGATIGGKIVNGIF